MWTYDRSKRWPVSPCPRIDLRRRGDVRTIGSSRPPDYLNAASEQGAAGGCIPWGSSLAGGLLLLHADMSGQQLETLCENTKRNEKLLPLLFKRCGGDVSKRWYQELPQCCSCSKVQGVRACSLGSCVDIPELHILKGRKISISVGVLPYWKLGMASRRMERDLLAPEYFVKDTMPYGSSLL